MKHRWNTDKQAGVRACLACLVGGVLTLVGVRTFLVEPFRVPSGSMAPALLGPHRVCECARCRHGFAVGCHESDSAGSYRKVACPNCGLGMEAVRERPVVRGTDMLVDRTAFTWRAPRRWEVVVLRLFGAFFIKRLIGLPHETLLVRDGDIYIDGKLERKTLAQARALRVPVFDQSCLPGASGWEKRWECVPPAPQRDGVLRLEGRGTPQTLTYRHFLLDERKAEPIGDEYAYNRGAHAGLEMVHDFLLEADVCVRAGAGTLTLRLFDGQDWAEVEMAAGVALGLGRTYHVDMAFVDRRLTLALDGAVQASVDWPEPGERFGVVTPVQLRAAGIEVEVRNLRLYRDIHYSEHGTHGVDGQAVRLGSGQYFVLGDNSPVSEDSRFWPDQGRVSAHQLVGRPLLAY